jgi:hypothetical protein
MMIKNARAEIKPLLTAALAEQQENIKIAQANAKCGFNDLQPYRSEAQRALIRGIDSLIALVEQSDGQ